MVKALERPLSTQPDQPLDVEAEQLGQLDELHLLVEGGPGVAGLAVEVVNQLAADELAQAALQRYGRAGGGRSLGRGDWRQAEGDRVKDVQVQRVLVGAAPADEVIREDAPRRQAVVQVLRTDDCRPAERPCADGVLMEVMVRVMGVIV